jgi:nuclear pore complex protein Nup133
LRFSLPPEVDEDDLMNGAEDLSRSVLESDSNIVTPSPELTSQMKERKNLLAYLMHFINENGALSKVS